MQIFQNFSLKIKIQLIIFTSIIIISSICFLGIYFVNKNNDEVLYNILLSSITYSSEGLANELNKIETTVDLIFSNNTLQNKLYEYKYSTKIAENKYTEIEIYRLLHNYIYNQSFINYISIYQQEKVVTTSEYFNGSLSDEVVQTLISRAKEGKGATVWINDFCEEEGLFVVKEIRRIENLSLEPIGILILNINLNELVESTSLYNTNYEDIFYILMDNEDIIYKNDNQIKDLDIQHSTESSYGVITSENKQYFFVKGQVPYYKWNYISSVSYDSIVKVSRFAVNISIFAIIISIIGVLLLSTRLITSLTKHFEILVNKMKCFGEDNYEKIVTEYDYSKYQDEISLLHNNFDKMVQKVNKLIEENYISELNKKESRIEVLESQIDPHFLYNTLEVINWRAKAIGAINISDMTMALGNILRIILKKDDGIYTLRMEIEALEHFITIQKLRYNDRICYKINILEETKDCEIPKLTLQPLVENAILYGLEVGDEVCKIILSSNIENNNLILEVKNTGSYFQENLLNKLEKGEIKPHGFGIGLLNIHRRIQMIYGMEYGLTLYNMMDQNYEEFAVTRVLIPVVYRN